LTNILVIKEGRSSHLIYRKCISVLIAGFGLPPLSHEDDPIRAVETAVEINAKLQEIGVACSIGVTTGFAFCGNFLVISVTGSRGCWYRATKVRGSIIL
jgi:hypothetical protein